MKVGDTQEANGEVDFPPVAIQPGRLVAHDLEIDFDSVAVTSTTRSYFPDAFLIRHG